MAHYAPSEPVMGLPNPETQPDFYESIPSKRLFAWFIDTFLIYSISLILSVLTLGLGFFIFFGMSFVIGLVYRWMTLASSASTWGMRLMAIQLRNSEGHKVSSLTALLHTLAYEISFSVGIIQLVSIITMLGSARKQGLHDLLLGTAVINNPHNG